MAFVDDEPLGTEFYGHGYWGKKVFWGNVPTLHRNLDADGHLEDMLDTWGDECETFLEQILYLPTQRDPYAVRAYVDEGRYFYVTESFEWDDDELGEVTRLVGEKDFTLMPNTDSDDPPSDDDDILAEWYPWWPYTPIAEIGRYWKVKYGDAEFEAILTRARNYDQPDIYDVDTSLANEIWLKGKDINLKFDYYSEAIYTEIGRGNGSTTPSVALPVLPVRLTANVGTSAPTWYTAEARLVVRVPMDGGGTTILYDVPDGTDPETGNLYIEDGGNPGEILTTTSYGTINYLSGEITIALGALGDSESGGTIDARWMVRGYYMEFYPPRIIDYLASDFGFDNDLNDPEDVQRSSIANLTKYFGLKSTQDSYRIRGEISLFDLYARGLWLVCSDDEDIWLQIPADHSFVYDGSLYTDLDLRFIHFDDISGDILFYDPDTSTYLTLADNSLMYQDLSADGMSPALAFSMDVIQGAYTPLSPDPDAVAPATVYASDALSDTDATFWGLSAGYRVVVSMTQNQFDDFTFSRYKFGMTEYDKSTGVLPLYGDDVFWIDYEDDTDNSNGWDAINERWTVIMGLGTGVAGPTVGSDVAIRYEPEVRRDCCVCKTHLMRMEVQATAEAWEFYGDSVSISKAIGRLKTKVEDFLLPIHVRIIEWITILEIPITVPTFTVSVSSFESLEIPILFTSRFDYPGIPADDQALDGTVYPSVAVVSVEF